MCFHSNHLYSCGLDSLLIVWDVISSKRLHSVKFNKGHSLRSIDVSMDGSLMIGVFMNSN